MNHDEILAKKRFQGSNYLDPLDWLNQQPADTIDLVEIQFTHQPFRTIFDPMKV
jgi:hypothetical protein